MPAVLNLKPEELDTEEKRGKYTVNVIGCDEKGVLYAVAFAEAGFKVVCTDADQTLVKRLAKGKTMFYDREIEAKLKNFLRRGRLSATTELKNAVSQSDIVVMTLTAKIDGKNHPEYLEVETACKKAGTALHKGALFIYGGTAGLGFRRSYSGSIGEHVRASSGRRFWPSLQPYPAFWRSAFCFDCRQRAESCRCG